MPEKINPGDYMRSSMTGIGLLSGFGAPDNPLNIQINKNDKVITTSAKGNLLFPDKLPGEDG